MYSKSKLAKKPQICFVKRIRLVRLIRYAKLKDKTQQVLVISLTAETVTLVPGSLKAVADLLLLCLLISTLHLQCCPKYKSS